MPASPTLIARTPLAAEQRGAVLAIGNFDGVHLGHQALIRAARVDALARGARAGVLTFTPHPMGLLAPPGPAQLTTDARRVELLAAAGAEVIVLEPFTAALAALPATAFLDEVLVRDVGVSGVVVGPDFCFGHGRSGNVATLRDAGRAHGFSVTVVPAVEVDGAVVSSSRVRAALVAGDLARATTLLGRPWDVDGVVVHGAKRGRAIGVPTANVAPDGPLPLPLGIYACWLEAPRPAPGRGGQPRHQPHVRRGRPPGARGPRDRLGRRSVRRARPRDLRGAPARRGEVRLARGAAGADPARHRHGRAAAGGGTLSPRDGHDLVREPRGSADSAPPARIPTGIAAPCT
jgi:riboflavin kinase/FMN adenylyltransferase